MTVWTDAVSVIHDSADFGEDATYFAQNRGPGDSVRIVRASPDETISLHGKSARIETLTFTVQVTECTPVMGDAFDVAGEESRAVVIAAPLLDTEGTEWTVTCRVGGYSRA